ncbi:MAG: hypothetical protein Q8O38_09970 [Sulfurimicrobium sp.]|nr:hypothetical protein [Sulfurimicrobium sp.]
MQPIHNPRQYPQELRQAIGQMSDTAIEIANRWALGWPQSVKELIASGEYLDALKAQEREEIRVKLEPGLSHLSSWEKAEMYGLSQSPPSPSTIQNDDEEYEKEEEESEAELHLKEMHKLYTEMNQEISQAFIDLVEKKTDEKGRS